LAEDTVVMNLKQGIKELLERREELLTTEKFFEQLVLGGHAKRVEAEMSERFAPVLLTLTRLIEANEDQARQAASELRLPDSDQAAVLEIRKAYMPFKTAIQSANAFEQGYINHITNVRYRPLVFLLTNLPSVDFTLRSFDKNVLRIADTMDNVMGLVAGIAQSVAAGYEKLRLTHVQMPDENSKKLFEHLDRAMQALASIKESSGIATKETAGLAEQHEQSKRRGS
jgi:hypothetical protein